MKVILIKNIEKLGQASEIKDVHPGYARNFLIPRKLAIVATDRAIKQVKAAAQALKAQKERQAKDSTTMINKLKSQKFSINAKADKKGKLYGAIDATMIAKVINNKFDFKIKDTQIELVERIKLLGKYDIPLSIGDNSIIINVEIIPAR